MYAIHFHADDGRGGSCDGSVSVCVPHDRSQDPPHLGSPGTFRRPPRKADEPACVDDGQLFNSLGPCPPHRHAVEGILTGVTLTAIPCSGNTASLEYSLPAASECTIAVYDIAGRLVTTLFKGRDGAGVHELSWNAGSLKSGMYFYRLQAGQKVITKSLLKVR